MATVALNQVPDQVIERLRKLAADHGADFEIEAVRCLERGLTEREQTEQELRELRELRSQQKGVWLTDEMINAAKREGLA